MKRLQMNHNLRLKKLCWDISLFIAVVCLLAILVVIYVPKQEYLTVHLKTEKFRHYPANLTDENINDLLKLININDFKVTLKPMLVKRIVGTAGHEQVKNYIVEEMGKLNWNVELDSFHEDTPKVKQAEFTNIIATSNQISVRYLVLACHYDSKDMKSFIGATDSAVPCAMIIYLAKILSSKLTLLTNSRVGLKLIFFDGEEAFVSWSATDSLYGSRHLAALMESKVYNIDSTNSISDLDKIDLLVLLDLLGAASPSFYSFFKKTDKWYSLLINIERYLESKHLLEKEGKFSIRQPYFVNEAKYSSKINDDHEPFLDRGVPVLHLIPVPFPNVWHTRYDNEGAINYHTVKNLLAILEVFVVRYLEGDISNIWNQYSV